MSSEKKPKGWIFWVAVFTSAALIGFAIGGAAPWWAFLIPWAVYAIILLIWVAVLLLIFAFVFLATIIEECKKERQGR